MKIKNNDKLLFIGDSITDAGRDYGNQKSLGQGYVYLIAESLKGKFPKTALSIVNRGLNGDTLPHLKQRWYRDCINLEPDLVSIFIGINDIWNFHYRFQDVSATYWQEFRKIYGQILEELLNNKSTKIILVKPYALPHPQERLLWKKDIQLMSDIIDELAIEYHAVSVELMPQLMAYGQSEGYQKVTGDDGIHPTIQGHSIISQEWLKQTGISLEIFT